MAFLISGQPTYFPPIFEPDYLVGEHSVTNPITGAIYGAFGLTVEDYEKRSAGLIRLWDRQHNKGSAYNNKRVYIQPPEPDMVEEFPPEDTRGIIAIFLSPVNIQLRSGTSYDLTIEVVLGNKTPIDVVIALEATDLSEDGSSTLVFNQTSLFLPSGTESTLSLAVKLSNTTPSGQRIIKVTGTIGSDLLVDPGESTLDIQVYNSIPVFYQVNGPEYYTFTTGDPVSLDFTTSNGMAETEIWEFDDLLFLQAHNLEFSESGVLTSTGVSGPVGTYQVTVFVEQTTDWGTKLYASKILEISVV